MPLLPRRCVRSAVVVIRWERLGCNSRAPTRLHEQAYDTSTCFVRGNDRYMQSRLLARRCNVMAFFGFHSRLKRAAALMVLRCKVPALSGVSVQGSRAVRDTPFCLSHARTNKQTNNTTKTHLTTRIYHNHNTVRAGVQLPHRCPRIGWSEPAGALLWRGRRHLGSPPGPRHPGEGHVGGARDSVLPRAGEPIGAARGRRKW